MVSKTWWRKYGKLPSIFEAFLHITLFFMVLEIGIHLPFSIFEVPFVVTAVLFLVLFLRGGWRKAKERFLLLIRRVAASKWLLIFLSAYILLDIIGIFYSPAKDLAVVKYIVVVPMAFFCVMLVFYCENRGKITRILWNIGVSGTFLAVFTLFNYFVWEILPVPYYRRLSMLVDYNRFATVVFIGFLVLLVLLLNSNLSLAKKYFAIFMVSLVNFPVLYLCGSRRTYLTLIPALIIIAGYQIISTAYKGKKSQVWKNAAALVLVALLVFSINAPFFRAFQNLSQSKYESYVEETGNEMTEGSIDTIIDSIGEGSMFAKRAAIWGLALDEAASYSPMEMVVGRGTSYEAYLYDVRSSEKLDQLYESYEPKAQYWMTPHNFLISDFLSGGILKLGASLGVWSCIALCLVQLLRYKTSRSLFYGVGLCIVFINCMISGRYSYIYEKHFWIFVALMILEWGIVKQERMIGSQNSFTSSPEDMKGIA